MAEARFKEILPRVADAGEAEKMMCRAIEGMTASKWHAGKNVDQTRYDSWERVFRSQDEFEVWLDQATSLTPYKESEPRILSGSYALTAPGRVTEDKKI
ncbi:MAG: hypothetical protein MUP80_16425 [Acidobacteriia bacterium]|nr:hypothetical protein [Terriglobia bacterium]